MRDNDEHQNIFLSFPDLMDIIAFLSDVQLTCASWQLIGNPQSKLSKNYYE